MKVVHTPDGKGGYSTQVKAGGCVQTLIALFWLLLFVAAVGGLVIALSTH